MNNAAERMRRSPLDALIPPELRNADAEALRRARLITVATLIMTAASGFFGWESWKSGGHAWTPQVIMLTVGVPVALSTLVIQWLTRRTDLAGLALCLETLVVVGGIGHFGSGARDPSQVWLIPLPVMGTFLLGPRAGLVFGLLVGVLEGVYLWMERNVGDFKAPSDDAAYFAFLSISTTCLALAALSSMFEQSRRDANEAQRAGMDALAEANLRLESLASAVAVERDQAAAAAQERGALLARMSEATRSHEAGVVDARGAVRRLRGGVSAVAGAVAELREAAATAETGTEAAGRATRDVQEAVTRLVELVDGAARALEGAGQRVRQVEQDVGGVARAVDSAAGAMRVVEDGARAVHERAANAAELGRVLVEEARRGATVVQETLQGMQDLAQGSARAAGRVRNLAEEVRRIGGTLEVIDDITRQVRMLSLNAAIIAMQSGEHGRGFAVVAEQMRELADRTAERTRESVSIIEALARQATATEAAMAEDETRALEGATRGADAQETLGMVARSLEAMGTELQHIAQESTRQAKSAQSGVREVKSLTDAARRAAESAAHEAHEVERVAHTGQEMRAMVPRVNAAVGQQARASQAAVASVTRVQTLAGRIDDAQRAQQHATDAMLDTVERLQAAQDQQARTLRALRSEPGGENARG